MRASTPITVGIAGVVAVAAVVSSFRGGGDDPPGAATTTTTMTAQTRTATTPAFPVGDIRRLPELKAGTYPGRLLGFTAHRCLVVATDLADFTVTKSASVRSVCTIWPSPGLQAMASRPPPPDDSAVFVSPVIDGRSDETGLDYVPGRTTGPLTVADDGAIAACDGATVRLARKGRVQTVRRFTPVDGAFDERCVTGAIGRRIVQLGDDRASLVDVLTHRVVRRISEPAQLPVVAIASSADGDVLIADLANGPPQGTVFDRSGKAITPRTAVSRGVSIRKLVLARGGLAVASQSSRGWEVTNLQSGKTLAAPGAALVNDVSFSPDGRVVAMATEDGIVYADVADLTPRRFSPQEYKALVWLP